MVKITVTPEVTKVVTLEPKKYTLELGEAEIKTLLVLVGNIAGDNESIRHYTKNIYLEIIKVIPYNSVPMLNGNLDVNSIGLDFKKRSLNGTARAKN